MTEKNMNDPRASNTRSKDFRYVYANGLGLQFGSADVMIVFGNKEDQASTSEKILEEVGVMMTHATAKLLAFTLTEVIAHFENATGSTIPIEQAKKETLEALLRGLPPSSVKASPTASPPPS